MKQMKKILICILSIILCLSMFTCFPLALTTSGGGTSAGSGSMISGQFLIPVSSYVGTDNNIGARVTVLTKSSSTFVVKNSIDVYNKTAYDSIGYYYHVRTTFNSVVSQNPSKLQYVKCPNAFSFATVSNSTSAYKKCFDKDMSFTLPKTPSSLLSFSNNTTYMNKILAKLGTSVSAIKKSGGAIIIEPIFARKINGQGLCGTVSDFAAVGKVLLGAASTGAQGSGNGNGWITIRRFTNRQDPNSLYLTSARCGIPAASKISSTSFAAFGNILAKGYGCMVVMP